MSIILPLFQHPTTIAWVDDDLLFLQSIKMAIKGNNKIFANTDECTGFFKDSQPSSRISFLHGEHNHESYDSLEHSPVDFDVTKIASLYSKPERFQEISVLVCDI